MTAANGTQEVVKSSQSNFASSFFFLSAEKKRALNAVYAWCRLTDDIVDQEKDAEEARRELHQWRRDTRKALRDGSDHPVLGELAVAVKSYEIPEEHLLELCEGCEMDLDKKAYMNFDELYPYCYKVASAVGLMCLPVFGARSPRAREYAVALGVAFQLTNIIRDIVSDAGRGRVYLPEDDLQKFSLFRHDMLSLPASTHALKPEKINQIKALVDFECRRAEHYYKKAGELLKGPDRRHLAAPEVMTAVYHAILLKIKRHPLAVLERKVKLSKAESVLRVAQGWGKNLLSL